MSWVGRELAVTGLEGAASSVHHRPHLPSRSSGPALREFGERAQGLSPNCMDTVSVMAAWSLLTFHWPKQELANNSSTNQTGTILFLLQGQGGKKYKYAGDANPDAEAKRMRSLFRDPSNTDAGPQG